MYFDKGHYKITLSSLYVGGVLQQGTIQLPYLHTWLANQNSIPPDLMTKLDLRPDPSAFINVFDVVRKVVSVMTRSKNVVLYCVVN